jgi:hypothetical protein
MIRNSVRALRRLKDAQSCSQRPRVACGHQLRYTHSGLVRENGAPGISIADESSNQVIHGISSPGATELGVRPRKGGVIREPEDSLRKTHARRICSPGSPGGQLHQWDRRDRSVHDRNNPERSVVHQRCRAQERVHDRSFHDLGLHQRGNRPNRLQCGHPDVTRTPVYG